MNLSFISPSRTVLFIADDFLSIYKTSSKGAKLVETVPWDTEGFEGIVSDIIINRCGSRPVLLINDMVEQHYRKERVIKTGVGALDRGGIVKRKLAMAFPSYPVRAALKLSETHKAEGRIESDIYLFAALPGSPQFFSTLAALKKSLAQVTGLSLLPVEAADMLQALSKAIAGKQAVPAKWTIFIGQHSSGGLRQIVTKDGELALTRMSPISASHDDPQLWAQEVLHEYKATMSYLSRFGFQEEDGLDIIFITSEEEAIEVISKQIEEGYNFEGMSMFEAARYLGLSIDMSSDPHYVDPLHVAWVGSKVRLSFPMVAKPIDKIAQPRKVALFGSIALLLFVCFQILQLTTGSFALSKTQKSFNALESQKNRMDAFYQSELLKQEDAGVNFTLIQNTLLVHDELETSKIDFDLLFTSIDKALGKDQILSRLEVAKVPPPKDQGFSYQPFQQKWIYKAKLYINYPSTVDVMDGNKSVTDLADRLADLLPTHTVNVAKLLKDFVYSEEVIVQSGNDESLGEEADLVAEIFILKPAPVIDEY